MWMLAVVAGAALVVALALYARMRNKKKPDEIYPFF